MVLEVEARDVLARTGTWGLAKGPEVVSPLLLEALPGTGAGDRVLVHREGPDGDSALVLRDLGSSLMPRDPDVPGAHLDIPAEFPLPPSLAEELEDVPLTWTARDGNVEVVHGASSRLELGEGSPRRVELTVLASAASLVKTPDKFVDAVMRARRWAGPGRLLYLPAVATPRNMALLVYMGTDVVDDVQVRLEAAGGHLSRPELAHLVRSGEGLTAGRLEERNVEVMRNELGLVREAVAHSALRELVEARARSEPWQVAALRRLDRAHADTLLPFCPVQRDAPLLALTREAHWRIEVTSWVEGLLERYGPPASTRVLLLLPCSARKPYSVSRTHRVLAKALSRVPNRWAVHQVVLTSPLGTVPRELERTYPAAHYDIPVSGEWYSEEVERMRLMVDHMRGEGSYDAVVSHMGEGIGFLDGDPSVVSTRQEGEGPLDRAALQRLGREVSRAASEAPRVAASTRKWEDLASVARVQFGREAGEALMRSAVVKGRPPSTRVMSPGGDQRAAFVPSRGWLSLTLDGAVRIAQCSRNRVWMDDFHLRGDLFAVGVTAADPGIRPGEEAVVLRGDEVVAVGVARMPALEMLADVRGVAVAVRHRRRGGRAT